MFSVPHGVTYRRVDWADTSAAHAANPLGESRPQLPAGFPFADVVNVDHTANGVWGVSDRLLGAGVTGDV
jgi:hypothetical protein